MIDLLLERVTAGFPKWLGWSPQRLHPVVLAGGPAHQARASMLIFADGARTPSLALKLSLSANEGRYLSGEFAALTGLRDALPERLKNTVPVAHDAFELGDSTVTITGYLPGHRLLVPTLSSRGTTIGKRLMRWFWSETIAWSAAVAGGTAPGEPRDETWLAETVHRFEAEFDHEQRARQAIKSFSTAVESSRIRWRTAWQHGDMTVGNVLRHRHQLRVVDFEATAPDHPPWFDLASAPAAAVVLANRQKALPSFAMTTHAVLSSDAWAGGLLRTHLASAWKHALPLGWAAVLTTMHMSLRRKRASRQAWRPYQELVTAFLCDRSLRSSAAWAVPEW